MDGKGFHHFYIGIVILLIWFYMLTYKENNIVSLLILSSIIIIDDILQHIRQLKQPKYRSPLNRLYGKYLYKISIIKKLNIIFDRIFKKWK